MADETFVFNLGKNDPAQADQMFFAADEKIKQGLFLDAKNLLEKAIEVNPKHGRAHNHLAWLYETKYQDFKKAEELYQKAIEFAPEYPASYANYAVVLSTLEKYDELNKHLEKALTVAGINKESIYNEYGIMYERQGKLNEAIEAYQKAMAYALNEKSVGTYKSSIERCKLKLS